MRETGALVEVNALLAALGDICDEGVKPQPAGLLDDCLLEPATDAPTSMRRVNVKRSLAGAVIGPTFGLSTQ